MLLVIRTRPEPPRLARTLSLARPIWLVAFRAKAALSPALITPSSPLPTPSNPAGSEGSVCWLESEFDWSTAKSDGPPGKRTLEIEVVEAAGNLVVPTLLRGFFSSAPPVGLLPEGASPIGLILAGFGLSTNSAPKKLGSRFGVVLLAVRRTVGTFSSEAMMVCNPGRWDLSRTANVFDVVTGETAGRGRELIMDVALMRACSLSESPPGMVGSPLALEVPPFKRGEMPERARRRRLLRGL